MGWQRNKIIFGRAPKTSVAFSGTYSDPGKSTFIGAINYLTPASYYFNRYIDEVRIYNKALTENEVAALANYSNFTISASPAVDYNLVATEHTVTATVNPALAFIPVLFYVTSVNTSTPTYVNTEDNGKAEFTYISFKPGEDTIRACIDVNANNKCDEGEPTATATKYWFNTKYVTGGG